jgi:hypothetical protein
MTLRSLTPGWRRRVAALALPALLAVLGACADAPTFPNALQWLADGEEWIAVLPPEQLPRASAWARFAGSDADAAALASRVSHLETEAVASLSRGDVYGAARFREQAVGLLERSIRLTPAAPLLRDAASAIDLWTDRVHANLRTDDAPGLLAALDSVAAARAAATRSLEAGDSIAAAVALIDAGERIRSWSPTLVAVRALQRAELRLAQHPLPPAEAARAQHLVRSAHDAVLARDPVRALQRAVYALQIAGGQEVAQAPDTRGLPSIP